MVRMHQMGAVLVGGVSWIIPMPVKLQAVALNWALSAKTMAAFWNPARG